ncbi:MAG: glycine cleavage system protein GcvH [Thermoguttaceae bacterium]|jgi:glycine cleavage system H protein
MPLDPKTLRYAATHEWVHVGRGPAGEKIATVGLSDFALAALTDLIHVELPPPGGQVSAGGPFGEVESVKAVSDLYSPVTGEIVEVNRPAVENPEALAQDPYGAGWLVKIRIADESGLAGLLDYAAYQQQCQQESAES